jgi:competence protein ComEA
MVERPTGPVRDPSASAAPARRIDLDAAPEAELVSLPRIGPALARRILADRDSLGPFGSLEALGRVKGVGPATLAKLAPLVTFSGHARR